MRRDKRKLNKEDSEELKEYVRESTGADNVLDLAEILTEDVSKEYWYHLRGESILIFEEAKSALKTHVGFDLDNGTMIALLCVMYLCGQEYKLSRPHMEIEKASRELLEIMRKSYGKQTEEAGKETPARVYTKAGSNLPIGSPRGFCESCGRGHGEFSIRAIKRIEFDGGRIDTVTILSGSSKREKRLVEIITRLRKGGSGRRPGRPRTFPHTTREREHYT